MGGIVQSAPLCCAACRSRTRRLLRLWSEAGRDAIPTQGGIELPYPLSRQDIADMSGNTLHTASRIMAAWEAEGILLRARRKVIIADPAGLAAIAEARA